jgi:multicomponent Na+:H+ antiporter subunit D
MATIATLLAGTAEGTLTAAPEQIAIAPLLVALATAVLTLLLRRWPRIQTAVSLGGSAGYAVSVFVLFARVRADGPIAYQLSAWPAPFGISAVADALSTLMLALAAVVYFGALVV